MQIEIDSSILLRMLEKAEFNLRESEKLAMAAKVEIAEIKRIVKKARKGVCNGKIAKHIHCPNPA